ncbi:hypothetical protein I79_023313 [Cricetulus griseus]|uniref:Uncharacterized protein n=1 Tax=Cricetulus griseus TaxID=10029 RepID=G3IHM1_CRIGR|nr:hypothetical protein I79_023313 [Cricetulus griseus]
MAWRRTPASLACSRVWGLWGDSLKTLPGNTHHHQLPRESVLRTCNLGPARLPSTWLDRWAGPLDCTASRHPSSCPWF